MITVKIFGTFRLDSGLKQMQADVKTAKELYQLFSPYQPELTPHDFYCMEIGSASIMRGYMAHPCDDELTLEKKLRLFLTMTLRASRKTISSKPSPLSRDLIYAQFQNELCRNYSRRLPCDLSFLCKI